MIQIVTVNSALSQNWVGCIVRTPKAQSARTLCPGCALAVRWAPCRGTLGAVSWLPSCRVAVHTRVVAPCCSPLVVIQKLCRDAGVHAARAQRCVIACMRALRRGVAAHVATPVTIQNLYHDTPLLPGPARALQLTPARNQLCRARFWLCCKPCCNALLRACALLCHDTICYIVTQHKKWAITHLAPLHIFFPLCSTYWKTTKKKKNFFFQIF